MDSVWPRAAHNPKSRHDPSCRPPQLLPWKAALENQHCWWIRAWPCRAHAMVGTTSTSQQRAHRCVAYCIVHVLPGLAWYIHLWEIARIPVMSLGASFMSASDLFVLHGHGQHIFTGWTMHGSTHLTDVTGCSSDGDNLGQLLGRLLRNDCLLCNHTPRMGKRPLS